jgi:hypothetical protein
MESGWVKNLTTLELDTTVFTFTCLSIYIFIVIHQVTGEVTAAIFIHILRTSRSFQQRSHCQGAEGLPSYIAPTKTVGAQERFWCYGEVVKENRSPFTRSLYNKRNLLEADVSFQEILQSSENWGSVRSWPVSCSWLLPQTAKGSYYLYQRKDSDRRSWYCRHRSQPQKM